MISKTKEKKEGEKIWKRNANKLMSRNFVVLKSSKYNILVNFNFFQTFFYCSLFVLGRGKNIWQSFVKIYALITAIMNT